MTARLCGRSRTVIIAWMGRPTAARSTCACTSVITPRTRSARTRSSEVDGATPSTAARSRLLRRPSDCNAAPDASREPSTDADGTDRRDADKITKGLRLHP